MLHLATLTIGYLLLISSAFAQVSDPALRGGEATFEGLGFLEGGDDLSFANDVSGDGSVVVGGSVTEGNVGNAFRWENGDMVGLGTLPEGIFSGAMGVSADGSVVVGMSFSGDLEAFRWANNEMEGLGSLPGGGFHSLAIGTSSDGSIVVGSSWSENGEEAFRWTQENGMEGLGDLPGGAFSSSASDVSADGSVVVGSGWATSGTEAFRWEADADTMISLGGLKDGGSGFSSAYAVSSDGSVVIGEAAVDFGNLEFEGFRWQDGEMVGLGDLPGEPHYSRAHGVSADGSMIVGVGNIVDETQSGEAFIWTEEEGMRDLREVLEEDYGLDLSGWTLTPEMVSTTPIDISDDGTVIVGTGINPEGNTEAWRAFLGKPVANEATPDAIADVLSTPSPNPTRGTSTFTLAMERSQDATVEVFDVTGRRVQTLYDGTLAAGMSETLTLDASALPAGVYVIRATGEDFSKTRRVTVVQY